jgi:hypothetical protein
VRIFKNRWFARFARKNGIDDGTLRGIADELECGVWDADYGGDVYKKRIARPGKGKSGGYRAIIIFRSGKRTYYTYGFPKSAKDDITDKEAHFYKKRAIDFFNLTDGQIQARLDEGSLIEIDTEA